MLSLMLSLGNEPLCADLSWSSSPLSPIDHLPRVVIGVQPDIRSQAGGGNSALRRLWPPTLAALMATGLPYRAKQPSMALNHQTQTLDQHPNDFVTVPSPAPSET